VLGAMCEAYGTRPSTVMGIGDPVAAFRFDEAVFVRHRRWLSEQDSQDRRGYRPGGYDPPSRKERAAVPWGGPGPDPLKANGT
jgi:hypothetical protein